MTKLRKSISLAFIICILTQFGCGPIYNNLAKGLYAISVGFDKLETFNELSYRAGDIDKAAATRINNDIIKAIQIKHRANDLMSRIDPNKPTPQDIDSVLAIVQEAANVASDAQQAGELGIKSPQGKQTFSLIITGITDGIAIARAVRK